MGSIQKDLVVTHVTDVRDSKYGLRVTINCYENEEPDTETDSVFMATLGIQNEILQSLIDQSGTGEIVSIKKLGEKINLSTGIRIRVTCGEIANGSSPTTKYINKINNIEYLGYVKAPASTTFNAKDVSFTDWGVVIATMDGTYVNDKFVFFMDAFPGKVSSMMEELKEDDSPDTVRVSGTARVYYATYPAEMYENGDVKKWAVRAKKRFDSRFDEPTMTIELDLERIEARYLEEIKRMKDHPQFVMIIKDIAKVWNERFVGESEMRRMGSLIGARFDTTVIPPVFLDASDRPAYHYMKSLIHPLDDTFYAVKKNGFKYIAFVGKGVTKVKIKDGNETNEIERKKVSVYDVKIKMAYVFSVATNFIDKFLEMIYSNNNAIFLDSVIPASTECNLVNRVKIDVTNHRPWLNEMQLAVNE